jgi:ribosomal subunit interface protein
MIKNLQISGVHSQLTKDMHLYVEKKIGGLYKYLPKAAREAAHVEVKLKEHKAKNKQTHECEVIMKLPHSTLTAHRNSTSILAAIDEVENNLKNQLKRYKDVHTPSRMHRHVIARFRRKTA